MCLIVESDDGREKWRFGLDDKNIYTQLYVTATEKQKTRYCIYWED